MLIGLIRRKMSLFCSCIWALSLITCEITMNGVPQGSVQDPIYLKVFINDTFSVMKSSNLHVYVTLLLINFQEKNAILPSFDLEKVKS